MADKHERRSKRRQQAHNEGEEPRRGGGTHLGEAARRCLPATARQNLASRRRRRPRVRARRNPSSLARRVAAWRLGASEGGGDVEARGGGGVAWRSPVAPSRSPSPRCRMLRPRPYRNSPILRRRLMNKELDPPVLLTMSPDELKAGLTAAEKTSEPEESRQLQMTDARCERCTEKKVGISDIIHAGHGDRYQLECTSCGHTWFSSRDAISLLTVDAPSTGGNVGTAPWATAKFDVLEKHLASPRDQPDNKPATDALQKSTAAYMPTLEKQKSFSKPRSEEPSSAPAGNHE